MARVDKHISDVLFAYYGLGYLITLKAHHIILLLNVVYIFKN
jgi:hypothetical protein